MHADPAAPRPRHRRARTALLPAVLAAALLSACGSDDGPGGADASGGDTVELTVLAAASLTDVFDAMSGTYEDSHPGVTLRFSFAGSQELAAQVREGVPADVLVTADTTTMDGVADLTEDPAVIARNALTLVTPPGNPAGVTGLDDLADPGLRLVLAAPEVPAGRYGRQILDDLGIDARPDSEEANVRAVLSKVQLGEADAGLVYVTDATAAGEDAVTTVPIPEEDNVVASYPAAALTEAGHPEEAAAFVDWLTTDDAQEILNDAGFTGP
ncbi:molybdate ABC transporter substrate-binding protein [Streptomyces sp. RFCAC02]|uniref:molybdate ABC transporter substrate-binding protein n=1 Tax=Streptomyces sp. RFCAC02 TaxID=2499143 RepID=UPI00101FBEDB|nr:molybdate ABC transporter substrate-binding protein [Streptomyces sp. RFCAC02]